MAYNSIEGEFIPCGIKLRKFTPNWDQYLAISQKQCNIGT